MPELDLSRIRELAGEIGIAVHALYQTFQTGDPVNPPIPLSRLDRDLQALYGQNRITAVSMDEYTSLLIQYQAEQIAERSGHLQRFTGAQSDHDQPIVARSHELEKRLANHPVPDMLKARVEIAGYLNKVHEMMDAS